MNPKLGLVKRFSKKEAGLAAKISNDIAEDIDCGETRKDLRMAVAYYADVACVEAQSRAAAESKLAMFRAAKGLMDSVLDEPSTRCAACHEITMQPLGVQETAAVVGEAHGSAKYTQEQVAKHLSKWNSAAMKLPRPTNGAREVRDGIRFRGITLTNVVTGEIGRAHV